MIDLPDDIEQLIDFIERMNRDELVHLLRVIEAPFPVDFTDVFLEELPLDRLKHLVLAVCLQVKKHKIAA